MIRVWVAVALAVAWCQGCGTVADRDTPATLADAAPERELLLMVREQVLPHYRPGAISPFAYGGGSGPKHATRVAHALAHDYGFDLVSDWPMPALGVRCFLALVRNGDSPAALAGRLAQDPRVESVQPQQLFHAAGAVDSYLPLQAGAQQIHLAALHRLATGKAIKIAEIDTGVDLTHPDLRGQLADARNFVESSRFLPEVHGTAVAGIIVAKPGRALGVIGVAPGAQLLPLRACWEVGDGGAALCTSFTLAKAMQFALSERVRVINLSLTGPPDRLLERLVDRAVADGITVVSALDPAHPGFPGTHHDVVAVVGEGAPGVRGAVVAPGTDVMSTAPGASWGFFSGSSFAAAHVTGIAALVLQVSPELTPSQMRELLREHTQASAEGPVLLDACAALAQAARTAARICRPQQAARGGFLRAPAS